MTDQQILKDVLEVVEFVKDQMVTRDEFTARLDQMVTRDELDKKLLHLKTELTTHIDGFIVLHQKLDTELAALRAKYDRLESFVYQLAKQANVSLQD